MRDFVETLPLRLAALVAALVGIVCLINGVDLWESARRIGISFVTLLLAGVVVRRLTLAALDSADASVGTENLPPRDTAAAADTLGDSATTLSPAGEDSPRGAENNTDAGRVSPKVAAPLEPDTINTEPESADRGRGA